MLSKLSFTAVLIPAILAQTIELPPEIQEVADDLEDFSVLDIMKYERKVKSAFGNFESQLKEIAAQSTDELHQIESQADVVESACWSDVVQLSAESTQVDGFTMDQLFPNCVTEVKERYDSDMLD